MIERLMFFLFHRQYEIGEMILGLLGILWGLWLLNPLQRTFDLASYAQFLQVGPEWAWGFAVFLLGCFTLTAAITRSYFWFRSIVLLINILVWSFIATNFLLGVPENTGFIAYFIMALFAVWLYLRFTILTKVIKFDVSTLKKLKDCLDK